MKNLKSAMAIATILASNTLWAQSFDPFVVKDIRVTGIERTEVGTVFSYLPIKAGDTVDGEKISQAVKALYATGFFKNVAIDQSSGVLQIKLEERPAIATIDFVGMKEFEKEQIIKSLKENGLAEARIFDRGLLEKAEQALKQQYLSKGKYGINLTTTITPLERNRVGILFNIEEGESAVIRHIKIFGAKKFAEQELLKQFEQRTPGLWTWYSKNDQYSRQKLSADLENLKSFYMNQGYLAFSIVANQVSISPDKRDVFIDITIEEGEQYIVSAVKLAGNIVLPENELKKLIVVKAGDTFSREAMTASTKSINEKLSQAGYAFANVNAIPEINKENNQAEFTIYIDAGKQAYVRRVNITGNSRTEDHVIRREMRQLEASLLDLDKVKLSKLRIDRLGFFKEVTVEPRALSGSQDQVDIDVQVEEKPTGSINASAGYSSTERVVIAAGFSQANIFGSGKNFSSNINTSKASRTLSLSYTDPYFTADGLSQTTELYWRTYKPYTYTSLGHYNTLSRGGSVQFGMPLSEFQTLGLGVGVDFTTIDIFDDSPDRYVNFVNTHGRTNNTLPISLGWTLDNKNHPLFPTSGMIQRVFAEVSPPPGKVNYYRLSYQFANFLPLFERLTWAVNSQVDYANGFRGDQLPFYKNYYAGGIGSVRSYSYSGIGPSGSECNATKSSCSEIHLGGTKRAYLNTELLYMPASFNRTSRFGVFFDIGQVFAQDEKIKASNFRKSAGLTWTWAAPIGVLTFSYGRPLNAKENDIKERFQFQLGTSF